MCARYITASTRNIEENWQIRTYASGEWERAYQVNPLDEVPILRLNQHGEFEMVPARWGLIPYWWRSDLPPPLMTFSARSEDAASSAMWYESMRSWRCLMPARGWYEDGFDEQVSGDAVPIGPTQYYRHDNGVLLAIAGLWSIWISGSGRPCISCAVLTRSALPGAHTTRMPVILSPDQFSIWLSPFSNRERLQATLREGRTDYATRVMRAPVPSH